MAGRTKQLSPVGSRTCDSELNSNNINGGKDSSSSDNSNKEQERFLPIANVSRIMKKSLPPNAKISKEAKETVQECVSEFISFITGEASDKCQREKRKTINGADLLWAMSTLGFENYVGPSKNYLGKYRETEEEKSFMAKQGDDNHESPDKDNFMSTDAGSNFGISTEFANNSMNTTSVSSVGYFEFGPQ
ncbi:hypothetical protein Scep_001754 [Stephania cephalantha]|uniref:Transcription factor CBF/NF-Y/archaeal histone domain-containing protein n=1 Tax=Stephania cephalantha TaxID=152367 RepID=A0AAP0L9Y3_9MAGN